MKNITILVTINLLMTACSSVSLNPFSDKDKTNGEYRSFTCNQKQQFAVKMLNQQQNVWLKMGDHEVYLTRSDSDSNEYSNEQYQLILGDESSTLSNDSGLQYESCQPVN